MVVVDHHKANRESMCVCYSSDSITYQTKHTSLGMYETAASA